MKNKKGFTLIELLAIIVILAIIAVITVPIILNIIDKAKAGAVESSAQGYKDAVNKYYVTKLASNPNYALEDGRYTVSQLRSMGVSISGEEPTNGSWVTTERNAITNGCLEFDGYKVTVTNGEVGHAEKGGCGASNFGGTYVAPVAGDTHKGIVYMDPTDLSATCNADSAVSTVGTKSGCMKFYIYDNTSKNGYSYMILDHSTSPSVKWYGAAQSAANGPKEALYQLYEDTKTWDAVDSMDSSENYSVQWTDSSSRSYTIDYTKHYTLDNNTYTLVNGATKARLIEAEEISTLYGNSGTWTLSSTKYYFGSGNETGWASQNSTQQAKQQSYAWLFDWMTGDGGGSASKGGSHSDTVSSGTANSGYWTASPQTSGNSAWIVSYAGGVNFDSTDQAVNRGIRPVVRLANSEFIK